MNEGPDALWLEPVQWLMAVPHAPVAHSCALCPLPQCHRRRWRCCRPWAPSLSSCCCSSSTSIGNSARTTWAASLRRAPAVSPGAAPRTHSVSTYVQVFRPCPSLAPATLATIYVGPVPLTMILLLLTLTIQGRYFPRPSG